MIPYNNSIIVPVDTGYGMILSIKLDTFFENHAADRNSS